MDFCTVRPVKATRKEHKCFWCDEVLPIKSEAVYISGKQDGDVSGYHLHPECNKASQDWGEQNGYDPDDYPEPGSMKRGSSTESKEDDE